MRGRGWRVLPWLGLAAAVFVNAVISHPLPTRRFRDAPAAGLDVLGAGSVPVLLVAGWLVNDLGASVAASFTGFIVAMLVLLPLAVKTGGR